MVCLVWKKVTVRKLTATFNYLLVGLSIEELGLGELAELKVLLIEFVVDGSVGCVGIIFLGKA